MRRQGRGAERGTGAGRPLSCRDGSVVGPPVGAHARGDESHGGRGSVSRPERAPAATAARGVGYWPGPRVRGGGDSMASPSPPADAFASMGGLALGMPDTRPEGGVPHHLGHALSSSSHTSASGCIASQAPVCGARQVPRRLWQPDNEAEECSLLACGKTFGYWTRERKHHCRQCGRVVCAACSGRMVREAARPPVAGCFAASDAAPAPALPRVPPAPHPPSPCARVCAPVSASGLSVHACSQQKVLLPPKGERGLPKSVRVCDACFGRQDTFSIPRSCSAKSFGSDATMDSESCMPAREMPSPSAPQRRLGQLKASMSSPAVMQLLLKGDSASFQDQSGDKSGDVNRRILACETDTARANSPTLASRADTQTPGSPNSDTKSSKTTSPVRVPRSNAAAQDEEVVADEDDSAAEQLLEDVAPADERRREWIANVQKKFGADPHYHVRDACLIAPLGPGSRSPLRCACAIRAQASVCCAMAALGACVAVDGPSTCAGNVEVRAAGAQGADYVHDGGAQGRDLSAQTLVIQLGG